MDDGTMTMPYGKYKGKTIEEIPSGYLRWMSENFEDDDLAQAADDEYKFRSDMNSHFED